MVVIKLSCDEKIEERMRVYNIEVHRLENFLTYIANNLINEGNDVQVYGISVSGLGGTGSSYVWGTDELEVALKCYNCRTKKERRIYFLQSLVHEFRHWVQSQLQHLPGKWVDYDTSDIDNRTDKYVNNVYEVECREWEKLVEEFNVLI